MQHVQVQRGNMQGRSYSAHVGPSGAEPIQQSSFFGKGFPDPSPQSAIHMQMGGKNNEPVNPLGAVGGSFPMPMPSQQKGSEPVNPLGAVGGSIGSIGNMGAATPAGNPNINMGANPNINQAMKPPQQLDSSQKPPTSVLGLNLTSGNASSGLGVLGLGIGGAFGSGSHTGTNRMDTLCK